MNIDFIRCEYGVSYGGGLEKPLTYLGRVISDRFQAENIEFPYQEIEIQLTSLSPDTNNAQHIEWYGNLPVYYRGKNMVRIVLPADKSESSLAGAFETLHKAFDIIISKKKKTDNFDAAKIKTVLLQAEQELRTVDLRETHSRYEMLERQERIERNRQERADREQGEKKRLIQDLRFYYRLNGVGNLYFSPYDNDLCNLILEKLREKKFRLPAYTHLYVMVSDSFENALYHAVRAEKWFVYGIAVFEGYAGYSAKKDFEKKRIVFGLIKQGLHDIARIDNLDVETLGEVLDEAEKRLNLNPA